MTIGIAAQKVQIYTIVMDHHNYANTDVVDEWVELQPGEEREFTANKLYDLDRPFPHRDLKTRLAR
jgi:hypothetical protein